MVHSPHMDFGGCHPKHKALEIFQWILSCVTPMVQNLPLTKKQIGGFLRYSTYIGVNNFGIITVPRKADFPLHTFESQITQASELQCCSFFFPGSMCISCTCPSLKYITHVHVGTCTCLFVKVHAKTLAQSNFFSMGNLFRSWTKSLHSVINYKKPTRNLRLCISNFNNKSSPYHVLSNVKYSF